MTDRDLDRLMESGLRSYLAGPTEGLDQRVLAQLRRREQLSQWRSRSLPLAGVAAAVLVMLSLSWPTADPVKPTAPPQLASIKVASLAASARVAPPAPRRISPRRIPVPPTAPAGIPLSASEARLLVFVQEHPLLAQQALVEAPHRMHEPLSMTPVTSTPVVIAPLESAASGGE